MAEKVTFTVNNIIRSVEIEGWEKLIDILREELGLTGTKKGCDDASCGACTVVVDGEARKSCVYPAKKVEGKEVITIEGLAEGKKLHPTQEALIEAGAVQCGFCTPGIVMELYALFNKKLNPSDEEITEALSRHLCRCTGYEAILEGAKLAREKMAASSKSP